MQIDKMIPHSVEAEEAVLGALLIDDKAHLKIRGALAASDFYVQKHGWIFDAVLESSRNGGVDLVTVGEVLSNQNRFSEIGGGAFLLSLYQATPTSVNVQAYAEIVRQNSVRRRLLSAASDVAKAAYNTEQAIDDVIGTAQSVMVTACEKTIEQRLSAEQIGSELFDKWADTVARGEINKIQGLDIGITTVTRALGGLGDSLYYLAGRPAMGKTTMACQWAANLAKQGQRAIFFTVETSAQQLGQRLICSEAHVNYEAVRRGEATEEDYQRMLGAAGPFSTWPLMIVDRSGLTPDDVLTDVQRLRLEGGDVAAVFIDGLWLMVSGHNYQNRVHEVGSISRGLKRIQRSLGIPIVCTHQLNRNVEYRDNKRPVLADLRDSGDVEQDGDVIMFLFRDDYYTGDASEKPHVAELICAKNRHGGTWMTELFFKREETMFYPITRKESDR